MRMLYIITVFGIICSAAALFFYARGHFSRNAQITIGLVGDVMLGRLTSEIILARGPAYVWGNMLARLRALDGLIINLETTITTHPHAVPKVFNFKADPRVIDTLKMAQVTVANLANNHSLDFGSEGLAETISLLHAAGIKTSGAGATLPAVQQMARFERRGITIGVIGCTDNEPTWAAMDNKPGIFYVDSTNINLLVEHIKAVRDTVDILIISYHWGPNWDLNPSAELQARAHAIINAGADLIHGHSAHIVQGIEQYNDAFIIYGAGDFVDDYAVDPVLRNDYGALYELAIRDKKIESITVVPTQIANMQVNKADATASTTILKKIAAKSAQLNTPATVHTDRLIISRFSNQKQSCASS